jgi:hypothetical protein
VVLGLIIVGGGLLRCGFVRHPIRSDEAGTYVRYASPGWAHAASAYDKPNNHILHTIAVRAVTLTFGDAEWAIRLPTLIAGILTIPAAYWVARQEYGPRVGLITAALVAASSPLVEFSVTARGYTLLGLLFLVGLGVGRRMIRGERRRWAFAFVATWAAAFYTIPIALYGFVTAVVWLAADGWRLPGERRRRALRLLGIGAAGAVLVAALLYVPAARRDGVDAIVANRFVQPVGLDETLRRNPRMLRRVWGRWNRDVPSPARVAALALFCVAVACHRRIATSAVPLPVVAIVVCASITLAQRVVPFPRVWLWGLPIYHMAIAAGLAAVTRWAMVGWRSRWRRRRLGRADLVGPRWWTAARELLAGAVAVALLIWLGNNVWRTQSVLASDEAAPFREAGPAAEFLAGRLERRDLVISAGRANMPLQYYLARLGHRYQLWRPGSARLHWRSRLYAVIDARTDSLESVIRAHGLDAALFGKPRLLWQEESARVYELRRRPAPTTATRAAEVVVPTTAPR